MTGSSLGGGPYNGVQPEYFLTWNVGRPHAQAWSGTTTDEAYSLPIVAEVGCLENLVEHGAAVFAPVHVVVSLAAADKGFLKPSSISCSAGTLYIHRIR